MQLKKTFLTLLFATVFPWLGHAATLVPLNAGAELTCQFVNNSGYPNNQVYILVLARDASGTQCYLNAAGAMVPVAGGQNTSMYSMTLAAFTGLQFPPVMTAGRLWISYGAPLNMATFAGGGIAQPNLGNPGDPNINTLFDWMEFTVGGGQIFCNTTQVDMFGIPYTMDLYDDNGGGYSLNSTRGIPYCYSDVVSQYQAFMNAIPGAGIFNSLVGPVRIVAPGHGSFAAGQPYGNYYDAYINSLWSGPFRPAGVGQPSTQDVFGAGGPLATQAQVDASINRHVLDQPGNANNPAAYYQSGPANYYAEFWHHINLSNLAYGFPYDDANNQSSLQVSSHPRGLVINLSGCVPTPTSTATPSRTFTPTATFSVTLTRTATRSPTVTPSSSATPSATTTRTRTGTPTFSATPTFTATATATPSRTSTATDSATPSSSATPTVTPSGTATSTLTATRSMTSTGTSSSTRTATTTDTSSVTGTVTRSATRTGTPTASATPSASPEASATNTATVTATPSVTPSSTVSRSATLSATATRSATASSTCSATASETARQSATPTGTVTLTATASPSVTLSPTASATRTAGPSATLTSVPMLFQLVLAVYNSAGERVNALYEGPAVVGAGTLALDRDNLALGGADLQIQVPGTLAGGLAWNGSTDSGQSVSTGIYYVKMETHDPFGSVSSVILPVAVVDARPAQSIEVFNSAGERVRSLALPAALGTNGFDLGSDTLLVGSAGLPGLKIDVRLGQGQVLSSLWDGRTDAGDWAESGIYSIVLLSRQGSEGTRVMAKSVQVLRAPGDDAAADAHPLENPLPAAQRDLRISYAYHNGLQATADLYSLAGERVAGGDDNAQVGLIHLDAGRLSAGVYLVRLQVASGGLVCGRKTLKVAILR